MRCSFKSTWSNILHADFRRVLFPVQAVYDASLNPENLHTWEKCSERGSSGREEHLFSSCSDALADGRYRWRHDQVNKAVTHVLHPSTLQTKRESRWPPTPARTENTSYNSKTKTDYKMKKVVKYQFRTVTLTYITLPSLWQSENWESPTASDSAAALLIWKDTL